MATASISLWLESISSYDSETAAALVRSWSLSEQQRLAAIGSRKRRNAYLTGHQLLRRALNQVVPEWPQNGRVEHPPDCPPRLVGEMPQRIWFNISHSDTLCACILSTTGPVGLDVEVPGRERPYLDLAAEYYAPGEAQYLRSLSPAKCKDAFYRLWTLKESRIKARQGSVHDGGMAVALVPQSPASGGDWHSYSFTLLEGFGAYTAAAIQGDFLAVYRRDPKRGDWGMERVVTAYYGIGETVQR